MLYRVHCIERRVLAALHIDPLERTSSEKQGKSWPRQLHILSGYLQGDQDADQSDDLAEEDTKTISEDGSQVDEVSGSESADNSSQENEVSGSEKADDGSPEDEFSGSEKELIDET
ncbi:MAG: hypothetical protein Q9214_003628 [Letrouitia sp. 1 TL-2023]